MNHKYLTVALLAVFALSPLLASAQGLDVQTQAQGNIKANVVRQNSTSSTSTKVRADVNVRASTSTSTKPRGASTSQVRIEFKKEIALRHAKNAARVLTALVERLEKIIVRIESRIAKIEAAGGNTTEAELAIAAAKGNLVDAKADIALLLGINLTGANAQENFDQVRQAAANAKADIRAAHTNLMKAVRSLRGPRTGLDVSAGATSTASTTAQ